MVFLKVLPFLDEESERERCCVISMLKFDIGWWEKKIYKKENQPKKSDLADALTVAYVIVISEQLRFLTLARPSRGLRVTELEWGRTYFHFTGHEDVVLWLFYGIRHKYNWRSWWSGKFSHFFSLLLSLFPSRWSLGGWFFPCCLNRTYTKKRQREDELRENWGDIQASCSSI